MGSEKTNLARYGLIITGKSSRRKLTLSMCHDKQLVLQAEGLKGGNRAGALRNPLRFNGEMDSNHSGCHIKTLHNTLSERLPIARAIEIDHEMADIEGAGQVLVSKC